MSFAIGEHVTRASYHHDLLFRIAAISGELAILHGEDIRLAADAPLGDLVRANASEVAKRKKQEKKQEAYSYHLFRQDYQLMKEKRDYQSGHGYDHTAGFFQLPTTVLHIDGDRTYMRKCTELYQRLGLNVHGAYVQEKDMPQEVEALTDSVKPHIVVITGHDAFSQKKGAKSDLGAYHNTQYFAEAVDVIRQKHPRLDDVVIFAGACQSHFESLIQAGANFASSPSRVNIHALDPVYIAAKMAYTPFMEKVSVWDVLQNTLTGEEGMGGVETKGLMRIGMPYTPSDGADD
ncbi:sporulation peptidase YabG [Barrientosiimonas marina]|uniref:Sporulation peptidase YabG n=1 Tax=Lentibacillus kimchii TaxID=1542911 RepID=A0ABW2UW86_9BACI